MRVVGGKTGADGKLFAVSLYTKIDWLFFYLIFIFSKAIVWTVPGILLQFYLITKPIILIVTLGGPAEKGGLQQGDKIMEWNGVSLVDRSFEEVCSIMAFSECEFLSIDTCTFCWFAKNLLANDIAELVVEQASDFRMSEFLEEGNNSQQQQSVSQNALPNPVINVPQRKNSDVNLSAGEFYYQEILPFSNFFIFKFQESENNEKREPASPTRRRVLPKTPV